MNYDVTSLDTRYILNNANVIFAPLSSSFFLVEIVVKVEQKGKEKGKQFINFNSATNKTQLHLLVFHRTEACISPATGDGFVHCHAA